MRRASRQNPTQATAVDAHANACAGDPQREQRSRPDDEEIARGKGKDGGGQPRAPKPPARRATATASPNGAMAKKLPASETKEEARASVASGDRQAPSASPGARQSIGDCRAHAAPPLYCAAAVGGSVDVYHVGGSNGSAAGRRYRQQRQDGNGLYLTENVVSTGR